MAKIQTFTFTQEEFTAEVNKCKDIFLENMVREKVITETQKNKSNQYAIAIHSKSMFGRFWEKLWKSESDKSIAMISIIKILD